VKYMLIIHGNQELWNSIDPAEWEQEIAAFDAFNKKFYDTGELLDAYGVADAAATKLVWLTGGQPAVRSWLLSVSSERLTACNRPNFQR
jgi:hypothetical protein